MEKQLEVPANSHAFFGLNDGSLKEGFVEVMIHEDALNEAVAKLDKTGLSFDATNYDFDIEGCAFELWLWVTGEIRTHIIGPDPDGDGNEWHYEKIDKTKILRGPVSITVAELANLIADALRRCVTDRADSLQEAWQIRETNLLLTHNYNHTR